MHGAEGGFVVLWVELVVVDPDVFPEAQTHHVQVIAAVTEGTGQLHEHCRKKQNVKEVQAPTVVQDRKKNGL